MVADDSVGYCYGNHARVLHLNRNFFLYGQVISSITVILGYIKFSATLTPPA